MSFCWHWSAWEQCVPLGQHCTGIAAFPVHGCPADWETSKQGAGGSGWLQHTYTKVTLTSHASLIGDAVNEFSGTHWVNGVSNIETSFSYTQYFTKSNWKKKEQQGWKGKNKERGCRGGEQLYFSGAECKTSATAEFTCKPTLHQGKDTVRGVKYFFPAYSI